MSGAVLEMLATELQRVLQQVWAPMDSAPKSWVDADDLVHGVYLLGYVPAASWEEPYTDAQVGIVVMWWEPFMGPAGCWYDGTAARAPSHWMPLPYAPVPALNG